VIFMTGLPLNDRRCDFLRPLPNIRLTKPFELKQLEQAIARVLEAGAGDMPR
jgi:hypothetical protein